MALTEVNSKGIKDADIATGDIADDAVTSAKIADDAIDSEHITDGSIDTAHIADNQITLAKMAGGTDGQIITYDASGDPVAVGPGTDGQVLTSTGAGSPPAFEDVPAGGATINNATENELVTVASTTSQLDAEANLTFDGGTLQQAIDANDEGYTILADGNHRPTIVGDRDAAGEHDELLHLVGKWNNTQVGAIDIQAGADTSNKDDGHIIFYTSSSGGSLNNRMKIHNDGTVAITDGDLKIATSGHGIDFSATSNHGDSVGSEILSDYETGKWTATLGNDGTFSASDSNCTYIKIGHAVFFGGTVAVPSGLSWSGGTELSGIPFTHTTAGGWHTANFCVLKQSNWDSNDRGFPTMWVNTSDKIGFSDSTDGNQGGTFRINTSTGHYFYFGGWYMTDQD